VRGIFVRQQAYADRVHTMPLARAGAFTEASQ
jgi:hypothetical protein